MKNLIDLRKKLKDKKDEMRALITTAQTEKRGFNDEEESKFAAMEEEARSLEDEIKLEERAQQLAMGGAGTKRSVEDSQHEDEFRNLGEFIAAYREDPHDPRLKEYRELAAGTKASGGVFVPPKFSAQLFEITPEQAVVRPRAVVIPADDVAPDASITFPALDQGAGSNMYGGVEVTWIGEGDEKPETNTKFKDLTLTPHEVAAHIVITDKLLRNAPAVNTIVTRLFRGAIAAAEDDAFLYGNGVGKPSGAVVSAATVTVPRETANQIKYADIVAMLAKAKLGGSLVWAASQSILPQLLTMKDDAGNLIFQPNIADKMTGTLLGYPIRFTENAPVLGTVGDLVLADLGYYLIKDGSGIFIQASEHPLFRQNKTIIKAFWNVDGKPWVSGPFTLKNGYQVSPFIKLGAPTV
ncbi:phage major capsid protein, HK97 family [Paenibacillus sp. FSL R7-269]|uniref:phage major capsid protein n=1 Tax=Paenibacillus sp. FSL R7-269 TaxID=1226755 RepID=UPI0003E2719D|nr:phage major capsid protein [Paenibacillus sp. FSL R7-269]ETT45228.1 phage major capsid protein, HK97 family [Paenibacillus sp. FSL R7-269]